MKGKAHIAATAITVGIASQTMGIDPTSPLVLIGGLIGSILPDADTRHSYMGKMIPAWLIFKHRSYTHSLFAMGLCSGLAWAMFGRDMGIGIGLGYGTHLLTDGPWRLRQFLFPLTLYKRKTRTKKPVANH